MIRTENRRPLEVRNANLAKRFATWLSRKNVSPNKISLLSIVFAVLAGCCLLMIPNAAGVWIWTLPVLAAVFIQCRLLCNLFDGMVAVEGGKGTRSGELFNDIPDRIADPLILIAAGYAITTVPWASAVGWVAGLLAVMTAYVRTLSASIGAPVDFRGPMAKQHRMAAMTVGCLLSAIEPFFGSQSWALLMTIVIISIGTLLTVVRRTLAAYVALEGTSHE